MQWRIELESLVEQTKAMLKNVNQKIVEPAAKPDESSPREPVLETALPQVLPQVTSSSPAQEEIKQRVAGFKAHQEKLRREREEYYLEMTAKTRAMLRNGIRNED